VDEKRASCKICVASADSEGFVPLLLEALDEFGVPVTVSRKRMMTESSLVLDCFEVARLICCGRASIRYHAADVKPLRGARSAPGRADRARQDRTSRTGAVSCRLGKGSEMMILQENATGSDTWSFLRRLWSKLKMRGAQAPAHGWPDMLKASGLR
jgi:hypothetical protein